MQNKHCTLHSGFCRELNNNKKRLPYVKNPAFHTIKKPRKKCGAAKLLRIFYLLMHFPYAGKLFDATFAFDATAYCGKEPLTI